MGFYTGRTGALKIEGKRIAKIRDWSLETTMELLSTTSLESTHNTFTPGIVGATGSATLLLYRLDDENTSQYTDAFKVMLDSTLFDAVGTGTTLNQSKVSFILDTSPKGADDIKFDGYITSANLSISTGELSTVSINFTVDGSFTEVFERTA